MAHRTAALFIERAAARVIGSSAARRRLVLEALRIESRQVPTVELHPSAGRMLEVVWTAATFLASYVALDWVSYVQPVLHLGITPWNPQAGLLVAFLAVRGRRWLPIAACAPLLAEVIVRNSPAAMPVLVLGSLWIGACYTLLAEGMNRLGGDDSYRSVRAAGSLAAGAAVTSLFVAAGYVLIFVMAGALTDRSFVGSVAKYWVGDLNGILLVTPLLLSLPAWRVAWPGVRARIGECAGQAAALLLTVWLIFALSDAGQVRFVYLLFIPVIWIALRWGATGATLGLLLAQIALIVAVHGVAPAVPLVDLQFLMVTLALAGLMLGATVMERAEALRRVAEREAEVQALLATAPDAMITGEPDGTLRGANRAARALFGLSAERSLASVRIDQILPRIAIETAEGRATLRGLKVDGQEFPADVAWVRLESPGPRGWVAVIRDATDRVDAEASVRERDSKFAKAMHFAVAGELASALAHEMNQPITAMTSYLRAAQLICAAPVHDAERLRDTLAKSTQEANRAAAILRRLRDFYAGKAAESAEVSVASLLERLRIQFAARCRAAAIQLDIAIEPNLPTLRADGMAVEMALQNLISNAIEALSSNPIGMRRLNVRAAGEPGMVRLSVEDSGSGVPADVLPQLFEPLNTSKADGMGLGLAISRSLLRMSGGDIAYRRGETLGGARFDMLIPIDRLDPARAPLQEYSSQSRSLGGRA